MVLAFPDLAATDMAGDFLCSYVEIAGTAEASRYFKALQPHIASYAKTMSPIVRRVAAGEADMGVASAMTVRQFLRDKAPVVMLYPQNGTSYWLYGRGTTIRNWLPSLPTGCCRGAPWHCCIRIHCF